MNAVTFSQLLKKIESYLNVADVALVKKAFDFAEKAHEGQLRKSTKPYITHPVAVSFILAVLEQDVLTIVAGLLHDTLEDCDVTPDDIKQAFGEDVFRLVDGVTKLSQLSFASEEAVQAENYRKMLVAMAEDIRVVIIKLADRLHNMRTIKFFRLEKQRRVATETLDIYAPLAHRLGMASIKWELEDLCFMVLNPEEFEYIKSLVAIKREEREETIETFITELYKILGEHHIKAEVLGRPKHFYSIYKKLQDRHVSFAELYDMLGVRIVVKDVPQCYAVLGYIHSCFKPISGRFKDYIAMPKSNMYQSLHTLVVGPQGKPVEVQIRTYEMDHIAEYGIAAHWSYKELGSKKTYKGEFTWLRQILDMQKEEASPRDFLKDLKGDLFMDEVFLFTPRGDVKILTTGCTALDFAYAIHSEVGHTCTGAKINGRIVPLHHVLHNGDRVEVLTSKSQHPKVDWLNLVCSRQARNKIKQWLKKQHHSELIHLGKDKLETFLLAQGFDLKQYRVDKKLKECAKHFNMTSVDVLMVQLAQGEVSVKEVASVLTQSKIVDSPKSTPVFSPSTTYPVKRGNGQDIRVAGETSIMVTLAKCCEPLPGDHITGIVVIGKGVSVHRNDCHNLANLGEEAQARLVKVEWDVGATEMQVFDTTLQVEAFDRVGILQDILNEFYNKKINIKEVKTSSADHGAAMVAIFRVELKNNQDFLQVKRDIEMLSDVYHVRRLCA